MNDLISRQAAIDELENDKEALNQIIRKMSENDAQLDYYVAQYNQVIYDINTIKQLPSAERHGRWILDENPHDGDCRCSVCGVAIDAMNERNHEMLNILTGGKWWTFYHYCPKCGASMDEVTE